MLSTTMICIKQKTVWGPLAGFIILTIFIVMIIMVAMNMMIIMTAMIIISRCCIDDFWEVMGQVREG